MGAQGEGGMEKEESVGKRSERMEKGEERWKRTEKVDNKDRRIEGA